MDTCALCDSTISRHGYVEGDRFFCCIGCQTVFNILSTKQAVGNFRDTALFKQAVQSGLIANPELLEQIRANQPDIPQEEVERLYLEIDDLWCPSCAQATHLFLLREKGVKSAVVDYATDLASVEYSPRYISKEKIFDVITSLGYTPRSFESSNSKPVNVSLLLRFVVAAFFAMNIMMFSYPIYAAYFSSEESTQTEMFTWLSFAASLPIVTYCAWPIYRRFWNALRIGIIGMETLILLGVGAAFAVSATQTFNGGSRVYYDSLSVIIAFVLLGKIIESKAKFSAKESLFRLSKGMPKRGRKKFHDGTEAFVPLKEIKIGDLLVAFSGERIVLDGVVAEGQGACDESLMTGEAIPLRKQIGSTVLGGTILCQGRLIYRAGVKEEKTALHQILQMVEHDIGSKTVYTRAADSVVRWFVPAVVVLAAGTFAGGWLTGAPDAGFLRALSVLLISCPCAIGIAAPLAESQTLHGMARLGAIVRNRGCLSILGNETLFAFDKTGTVTHGQFRLLKGVETLSAEQRSLLKGLVSQSIHPIACAIAKALSDAPAPFTSIEEIAGRGMRGIWQGKAYFLGSKSFMELAGLSCGDTPSLEGDIATQVHFANKFEILTTLELGDAIRDEAPETLAALIQAKTLLLSGDSEPTVKAVAKKCGFDTWKAGCTPLQKRDVIDTLRTQGEVVAMIGDGMNDAPALTGANVSISVVNAADMSIQVSDILLTTDRLTVLPSIRNLAKKGQKIVRQNLFWAFFYNVIGIGLAVTGYLNPLFSAFAMVSSSLIVLFNARRIQ